MKVRMIKGILLPAIIASLMAGCAKEMDTTFQKTRPDPEIRLFRVFDNTPAIKSMFSNIDESEFNRRANDMLNANPELSAHLYQKLGSTFYGPDAVFPQAVTSMAESLKSFHSVYSDDPDSLDAAFDVVSDILGLDSGVMMGCVNSVTELLVMLRNWKDDNGDGIIDVSERDFYWDLFSHDQELSDIGYDGLNLLIENFDFVHELYDGAGDLDDPKVLVQNFIQALVDTNKDVEQSVIEVIDYIENPKAGESVRDIEEEIADWMVADPEKSGFVNYLINSLYPMIAYPVLENAPVPDDLSDPTHGLPSYITTADDYKNFVKRGRWLLDEQARIFSVTSKGLFAKGGRVAPETEESKTLLTQWLVDSFYQDVRLWDNLETIPVFDFSGNPLLKWLGDDASDGFYSIAERLKSSLELTSDDTASGRITRKRMQDILWNGWTYVPHNGGKNTPFRGIFYVDPAYTPGVPYNSADDPSGYVAKMARTRSADEVRKPFRRQVHDILNGNKDGNYDNDGDPLGDDAYKRINLSYGDSGESQIEAIMTNLQLFLLSEYFCTEDTLGNPVRKWALTPEDAEAFFGAANRTRNLQTYTGNILTSLRNLAVLDREGRDPSIDPKTGSAVNASAESIPMLGELVFVTAAGYGIIDPGVAPAELTLKDCLTSMGSDLGSSDYIELGLFDQTIRALGNNTIYRWDANSTKGNYNDTDSIYATQSNMPAQELLQPGTFRSRRGSNRHGGTAIVGNWRGKFSSSQGDIRGIVDVNENINTTNWTMTEIALACWEGYGPYTFKGRAPNGSACKYKSDYYTDWYGIKDNSSINASTQNRAPGVGHQASLGRHEDEPNQNTASYGRYHVYEVIYRPENSSDPGFKSSATDSSVTELGYKRPGNNIDYHDNQKVFEHNDVVVLDCVSREEAIRKNFQWLLNQKKYTYMIPIQGDLSFLWGAVKTELFAFSTINCNGVLGVARAKRYGGNISDNAKWGLSGVNSNRSYKQYVGWWFGNQYVTNYIIDLANEADNTFRFNRVSFIDQDYSVALDYTMYISGIGSGLTSTLMDMMALVWNTLGGNPVLPPLVGDNFHAMGKVASEVYTKSDLMDSTSDALVENITKFWKFYRIYYGDAGLFTTGGALATGVTPKDLPPVPRVTGVRYPETYNTDGTVNTWKTHTGSSKGKFEDVLGILTMAMGTMHEDGAVYKDIAGTQPATEADINSGNIAYYAKDGFRANIDTLLMMTCALNDRTKNSESSGKRPNYDVNNFLNVLVDNNPSTGTIAAGDRGRRRGLLPAVLKSKYLNINNINPVKEGMESAIKNVIRSYLDSFMLSAGPGSGDLESYSDPDINWNTPVNRLRYFADNDSLDQLSRSLDMLRDLMQDDRFLDFMKKSIPALNDYLYIKWLEERWDGDPAKRNRTYAKTDGLLQLDIQPDDVDEFRDFLNDFAYADFIDFIQESGLNDIERFYNFSFDTFFKNAEGEDITPYNLYEQIGNLNTMLIQYFSVNLLEGAVLGVYEILPGATDIPEGLSAGDLVWGYGRYEKFEPVDRDDDGEIELDEDPDVPGIITGGDDYSAPDDGYVVVNTDSNGKNTYFRYFDAGEWIQNNRDNESAVKVVFEGLTRYFAYRHDDFRLITESDVNSQYCLDYVSPWFRAGRLESPSITDKKYSHDGNYAYAPNVFNLHNYDLRMDWAMTEFNKTLLGLVDLNFSYGNVGGGWASTKLYTLGKNDSITYRRPVYNSGSNDYFSVVNWLFGWNGTAYGGLNARSEMNFAKDYAMDYVFDEVEVSLNSSIADLFNYQPGDYFDPAVDPDDVMYFKDSDDDGLPDVFDEKFRTTKVRTLVQKARDYMNINLFEYEYAPGQFEKYATTRDLNNNGTPDDLEDGHRHAINNITEIVADLLSPVKRDNPNLPNENNGKVHALFDAWMSFTDEAQIEPDNLGKVQKAAGDLLWDPRGLQPETDTRDLSHLDRALLNPDLEWDKDTNPYVGYYTHLFGNTSESLPGMLRQFQGMYADLVQLGLLAFSDDGVGSYLLDVMSPASSFDSWDLVEEFNYLINTNIFQNHSDRDTFWWQAGNLLEDIAIILLRREERGETPVSMDYFGAVSGLFR